MDLVEGVCGIRSLIASGGIFSWKKSGNRKAAGSILICDVCHHHGHRRYFPQLLVAGAMITRKIPISSLGSVIGSNIFYGCFVFGTTCFYILISREILTEWMVMLLGALCLVLLVKIKEFL